MIKKSQTKSGLLVSLLFISAFCIPFGTVSAESQEFLFKDTLENMSYEQLINADDSIGNMMGGIFSSVGSSGGSAEALGHVLSLLFMNLANLSWDTRIPHCYTLYANYTTQEKWDESFNDNYTMWINTDEYN
ncbi:MAG: hypothetical protein GY870_02505, partial [archaeon]|nr:hypothetical protein [archaeon]